MKIWVWLGETKNQQILGFVGGGLVAVVTFLVQFGVFDIKPSNKTSPPAVGTAVHPAPATSPATSAVAGEDLAVQALLNALVRKEKADKAEQEYKQERDAWDFAQKLNTSASYQAYLSEYPQGHYVRFANAAVDAFRSPIPVKQPAMNF